MTKTFCPLPVRKVPVVVDLPGVGQNLQDHFNVHGLTWTVPRDALGNPNVLTAALQYLVSMEGQC